MFITERWTLIKDQGYGTGLQPPKFNIFSLYLTINKIIVIIIIIFEVIFMASSWALYFYI